VIDGRLTRELIITDNALCLMLCSLKSSRIAFAMAFVCSL